MGLKFILFKGHNVELISQLFQILLVTYLGLLLAEEIFPGLVSIYLNLNYLLGIVILVGILSIFSEEVRRKIKVGRSDYFLAYLLGIVGFVIVKIKTGQLGVLSWVVSGIAGVLIVLLNHLVLEDKDE